jgi:hypothetical protein
MLGVVAVKAARRQQRLAAEARAAAAQASATAHPEPAAAQTMGNSIATGKPMPRGGATIGGHA